MESEIWKSEIQKVVTILSKQFEILTKTSRFPMVRFLNGWDHTYSPILCKLAHLKSSLQMFPDFEWSDFRSPL